MNIIKNIKLLGLLLGMLFIFSCSDDIIEPSIQEDPDKVSMKLELIAVPEEMGIAGTKSITENVDEGTASDYHVKDFWIIQYNDTDGKLIPYTDNSNPKYYTTPDNNTYPEIKIKVPEGNATYRCIVIANTHDASLFSQQNVATIDDLADFAKVVHQESDLYQRGTAENDLLMNGEFYLGSENAGTSVSCYLYRSIAKLTIRLTNSAGSGVFLSNIKLCNIPDKIYYADQIHKDKSGFPELSGRSSVTLLSDYVGLDQGNPMKEFVYYVPRNVRGSNKSTSPKDKNKNAVPLGATYIEIVGVTDNLMAYRYRFYPGNNMVDNFDIESNHNYIIPIDIKAKGNPESDSRVTCLGKAERDFEESNSYIIDPNTTMLYKIPVTQVNNFWEGAYGTGEEKIKPETEWVAEVVWQDVPDRIIDFCNADGTLYGGHGDYYEGKGETPVIFLNIGSGIEGNFLLGVRDKNQTGSKRQYFWTWYFWMTQYDPYPVFNNPGWNVLGIDKYSYDVPGGRVFRFDDVSSGIGWGDNGDPWGMQYYNKYIMDRNLGAMSADRKDGARTWGLLFQYGRKDPFPQIVNTSTRLWDINGEDPAFYPARSDNSDCIVKEAAKNVSFAESVLYPYVLYFSGYGQEDWKGENELAGNPWNSTESSGKKSLLDPCPPGWKIPDVGVFDIFRTSNSGTNAENTNTYVTVRDAQSGYNFYLNTSHKDGTTWFPAVGYRNYVSGAPSEDEEGCNYWQLPVKMNDSGVYEILQGMYTLKFDQYFPTTQHSGEDMRFIACPIRCIQDPDYVKK